MGSSDGVNGDRRQVKRVPEPYGERGSAPDTQSRNANSLFQLVKTTSYILKKYAKYPPSFTIHLHPTHFRFDQQDGSFPYNSEMKVVIEHLKAGTVPHDMMEELIKGGVRFYEGILVQKSIFLSEVNDSFPRLSYCAGGGPQVTPKSIQWRLQLFRKGEELAVLCS